MSKIEVEIDLIKALEKETILNPEFNPMKWFEADVGALHRIAYFIDQKKKEMLQCAM